MGIAEDRAYWYPRAGFDVDPTFLTLDQLIRLAQMDSGVKTYVDNYTSLSQNSIRSGEATIARTLVNNAAVALAASQSLTLTHFTCRKKQTVNSVRMPTGGTAAGATPTLCRIGLYTVADSGDIALVASTANDTTLFAAANTSYTKALSAAYTMLAGQRYALGVLVVTAAATPTFCGASALPAAEHGLAPKLSQTIAAQADLPASVAIGSLVDSNKMVYGVLIP